MMECDMFLSAFNHQIGLDGRGLFLVGRLPFPAARWSWPGRRPDPAAGERAFLHRYRTFLVDEIEDVRHRITALQGLSAR
jgi:hypothetical protein